MAVGEWPDAPQRMVSTRLAIYTPLIFLAPLIRHRLTMGDCASLSRTQDVDGQPPGKEAMDTTTDPLERRCESLAISAGQRFVSAAAAKPPDHVVVIGSGQIELLLAFLHQGFSNVDCLSSARGPRPQPDTADIVIAPDVTCEAALLPILQRFTGTLRRHGVFIVRFAKPLAVGVERQLRRSFFEAGFAAVERFPARDGSGHIWCAYKQTAAVAKAA